MMGYVAGSAPRIPGATISSTVSELQACGTSLEFVKGLPLVHSICIFEKCAVGRCMVVIGTLFGAPCTFVLGGVLLGWGFGRYLSVCVGAISRWAW